MHKTAVVFPTAYLGAPCIIGPETEVRHCAFIRGSALVGAHCVVGNSVELKNVILFDNVQTPHYNYVGDSILGYKSHMGAGSITSNVKSDKTLVTVKNGAERIETGRKKFGAILGDHVEVGCNSVLNPGTVVGRGSSIYPVSCVRGAIPAGSIVKTGGWWSKGAECCGGCGTRQRARRDLPRPQAVCGSPLSHGPAAAETKRKTPQILAGSRAFKKPHKICLLFLSGLLGDQIRTVRTPGVP